MKTPLLALSSFILIALTSSAQAAVSWGETISAGSTQIKAVHINEIRDSINDIIDGSIPISGAGKWIDGATAGEIYYNTGNVGIGIANPDAKLDVSGVIRSNGTIQAGAGGGGVAMTINDGYGNANLTFNHAAGRPEQNGNAGRIEVNTDSTTDASMYLEVGQNLTSGVPTNLTSVMTLKSTGNVGIGTTTPTERLQVEGTIKSGSASATNGSTIIEGLYSGSDAPNVLGSHYSTGATVLGYGVRPRNGSSGYVSSADNVAWPRGAIEMTDSLVFKNAGSAVVAEGAAVSLAERFRVAASGNVGIGTAAPSAKLDVLGNTEISGNLAVGPQASPSVDRVIDARKNFSGDGNYYHMYTAGTVSGDPTANRSAYGGLFSLTNNRGTVTSGDRGYGYGVRGYVTNSTGAAKGYYNAGGSFESRNAATAGVANLRGVSATAFQNATSGTADTLYAVEGNSRGRTSTTTSVIGNARGTMGSVYPYNTNITNAYGAFGYTATNNGYSGNIGTAFGVRGDVNHDSDDGATMTSAYGGYFRTYKRATAPNIGTAYAVYATATGGNTNYGIYSAAGRNYFNGDVGIGTTNPGAKLEVIGDARVDVTGGGDFIVRDAAKGSVDNPIWYDFSSGRTYLGNTGASGANAEVTVRGDLEVTGNIVGSGASLWTASGANINRATGNVGIKTASPQASLHVNDSTDLTLASTNHAATFGTHAGTNVAIDGNEIMARNNGAEAALHINNDGGDVTFHNAQGSGTQVVIKDNGRVGIGTASPTTNLEIGIPDNGAGNKMMIINGGAAGQPEGGEIRLATGADHDSARQYYFMDVYQDDFRIGRAGVGNDFILRDNGNIGIGTTPSAKLHVSGTTRFSGGSNTIQFDDSDNNNYLTHVNSNRMYFMHDANDNMSWDDGDDDRITMYSPGNGLRLGIGTSTPTSTLHIPSAPDVGSVNDTTVGLLLGSGTAQLAMDGNEMQAHNGTTAITYGMNPFGGGVRFNNTTGGQFEVGTNLVGGNYGTVSTSGNGKGGYEGYSINDRYVFMSNDNDTMGHYNDIDNRWISLFERNTYYRIYEPDSASVRFQIHANGRTGIGAATAPSSTLEVFGNIAAANYCDANGANCNTAANLKNGTIDSVRYNPGAGASSHANQISSRHISSALNISGEVTFYAANQDTANFLCREKVDKPFGYWRNTARPSQSGWQPYHNLAIASYDPTVTGSRAELCTHGSTCYSGGYHYGTWLECWDTPGFPTPGNYPSIN